jgi:predicted metal-binding membrane protein
MGIDLSATGSPTAPAQPTARRVGLAPALDAARTRLGLIALLFVLAAVAWWSTADRMQGMDDGPGTELGALGWFLGVWVVMMAAMMFPSVWPTVVLYAHMARRRARTSALVFAAGYLVTWTAAGLVAYALFDLGRTLLGDELAWDNAGRWLAGGTLLVAAAYELTPLKDVCLAKCRSPLGFLMGAWRDGLSGGFGMGVRHGAWCVGCCWALMASLFALGVMSLAWMAFVAALIALEKTLPWRRTVTYATAAILLALGIVLLAAPESVPGLTLPGGGGMDAGGGMDRMRMH